MSFETHRPSRSGRRLSRRRFLAAAAAAGGTIAGCTGVTDQEFEAQAVGLPEDARGELVLAETARDSLTTTREVEAVDGEVSITSRTVAYARGPALSQPPNEDLVSLLGRYLQRANGTEGPGAAAAALASGLGLDEVTIVEDFHVDADRVSLVAPAGLRVGEAGQGPLVFAPVDDGAEVPWPSADYVVDAVDFFSGKNWIHEDAPFEPSRVFRPEDRKPLTPDTPVVLMLGDHSPEEVFGVPAEELPGRPAEDAAHPDDYSFVATTGRSIGGQTPFTTEELFEVGAPAPTGGATYGLGVLSTPAAQVAGQSINPVAGMGFQDILTSEQARGLLKQAGVTDAEEVEWLAGPSPVADYGTAVQPDSPDGTTILNQETELKSFLGVVSGEDGPWGVGVHMARVEHDREGGTDVVVTAATHRWPVATADYVDWIHDEAGEWFTGILGSILSEAGGLTAATGEHFVVVDSAR